MPENNDLKTTLFKTGKQGGARKREKGREAASGGRGTRSRRPGGAGTPPRRALFRGRASPRPPLRVSKDRTGRGARRRPPDGAPAGDEGGPNVSDGPAEGGARDRACFGGDRPPGRALGVGVVGLGRGGRDGRRRPADGRPVAGGAPPRRCRGGRRDGAAPLRRFGSVRTRKRGRGGRGGAGRGTLPYKRSQNLNR